MGVSSGPPGLVFGRDVARREQQGVSEGRVGVAGLE